MNDELKNILSQKICSHQAKVAVIGLGYVGLPLAVEKAKADFQVIGIDCNSSRVQLLAQGKNYILDVHNEDVQRLIASGKLQATDQYNLLAEADVIIICVPTPLTITKDPDMSYIQSAVEEIIKYQRPGQLITLESTTYPGTTAGFILPQLEASGLRVGSDFFLAYSPERVDPGNIQYSTKNTAKVVGGVTSACRDLAVQFYRQTIDTVVPVSSPAVAEMTKVFENTYRAVNIALVNEIMMLCDRMGINVWEVVEAAATKPFGIQKFYPGPGVGGHCIPVDPNYLVWKAREYDFAPRLIELSGQINLQASYYVVNKVAEALNKHFKCTNGANILVLGVTYKKDIDDLRESPALKIIALLQQQGAAISFYDPYVQTMVLEGAQPIELMGVELNEQALDNADCILIITDHSDLDYSWIVKSASLVVDTRNATRDVLQGREKIINI